MNGIDSGFTIDFTRRFGLEGDFGYVRHYNVFTSTHSADLLTYMGGGIFYLHRSKKFNVYARGLFGGSRETGVNYAASGSLLKGYVGRPAYAAGGGVEYKLDQHIAIRMGAEFMHTTFFNTVGEFVGQNDLRGIATVVYTFGGRSR